MLRVVVEVAAESGGEFFERVSVVIASLRRLRMTGAEIAGGWLSFSWESTRLHDWEGEVVRAMLAPGLGIHA